MVALATALTVLSAAFALHIARIRRGDLPSARAARGAFISFVLSAVAVAVWAHPFEMAGFLRCFAFGFGMYAALLLVEARIGTPRGPVVRAIELVAFNLCLFLFLGEIGLRAVATLDATPLLSRPSGSPRETLARFRCDPGELRFGFPCDALGNYDAPPPTGRDGPLVCVIGDSFSIGVVPHHYHYTTVAERALGFDVYNIGAPNLAPPHYLHLIQAEALPLTPDAVVVALFIGNDVYFPTRRLRAWFDRDNVLMWQVPRRLRRIATEHTTARRRPGDVPGHEVALERTSEPEALVRAFPWLGDPASESAVFSSQAFLEIETERAVIACTSPESVYERLFEVLDRMVTACGDTPLVLLLIPDEFQVEDDLWQQVLVRSGRPLDRERPQRLIHGWLQGRKVAHCDLLPILRDSPKDRDGRRHVYHLQDTHFNARGNQLAGDALARTLRQVLAARGH